MVEKIDSFLVEVTRHVFSTMLGLQVEPGGPMEGNGQPAPFTLEGVSGCIGFGGKISGTLFLSVPDAAAERMAHILLGGLCSVGAREISDVIGELTNMLAGGCKSRLCDSGYPVQMSIPNIIRGQAVRAIGRDVSFQVRRQMKVPALDTSVQALFLGRIE